MENEQELRPELRAVLEHVLTEQGLVLRHHAVTSASGQGQNFLGVVLRVTATGTDSRHQQRTLNLIFKCPPASKKWREDFNTVKFTRNETRFYTQILPQLDTLRKIKVTIPLCPAPKLYYSRCDSDNDVLVMEDLCASGFRIADKDAGLDLDHCTLVLQELGRLHATSIAMKVLKPQEFAELKEMPKETVFFEGGSRVMGAGVAALQMLRTRYPSSNYAEILSKFTDHFFPNMCALVSTESALSVINHGDCWTNNLLFSYDSAGRPEAMRWIDFQLGRYGSLALDLSYFLYTCTTQALREEQWEELLTVYLAEVNETLALLRLPASQVSRAQLDVEMACFARYGVGMALIVLPLITKQPLSLDQEGGRRGLEDLYMRAGDNPLCVRRITDMVVDAIHREYLA